MIILYLQHLERDGRVWSPSDWNHIRSIWLSVILALTGSFKSLNSPALRHSREWLRVSTVNVRNGGSSMHDLSKILVVDDDIHLGKFLKRQFGQRNYQVDFIADGKDADDQLRGNHYALLIIELNLPGIDGFDLLKRIHAAHPRLPILVLTERNRTEDIVRGLDAGADAYLKKPFSFLELAARVQVLLSRNYDCPASVAATAVGLTIDRDGHRVFRGHRRIDLTQREFEILEYLMKNAGRALSRKTLMEDVWKVAYDPATNIVDVYMKYLRDKIDLDGETKLIRTIRGVGYVLTDGCELPPKKALGGVTRSMFEAATAIGSTCAA